MPQVLVRDVDQATINGLKVRAAANHRSLEAELRVVLQKAVQERNDFEKAQAEVERIRTLFAGRAFSDSADLLREDRER